MSPIKTYIGLGSNLGDSVNILKHAVRRLSELGPVRASKLYRSVPMGPQDQPDYFNAVVCLMTTLKPLHLLDYLQSLEQEAGRVRLRHWGERTLDLDLLIYGDESIKNNRLTVPHIGLFEREFVVVPLLDLDFNLTVNNQKIKNLKQLNATSLTIVKDERWINHST